MTASRFLLGLLPCAILLAPAAIAGGSDSCTCQHIESLQQETENAAYAENFFGTMSGKLKALEDRLKALKKDNPSHPDASLDILSASGQERERLMKDFHLPHAKVKGYTGPTDVKLEYGKCTNKDGDLKGLASGASCKEIGTITLEHEARHRATCEAKGADAYWARLPSELAMEEAERYAEQATAMREMLKHVIDGATVEIESVMTPVLEGHGMRLVYKYVIERSRVEGSSTPGSDRWTLRGEAQRIGTIESVQMPGMSCTPTGRLTDAVTMALAMDGFTMDLGMTTVSTEGDVGLKCTVPGAGSGFGQSMRPMGEGGSGTVFSGEKVQLETTHTADVSAGPMGAVMQGGGMTLSGQEITSVKISCPLK